jgi:hypothetical protein
MRNALYQIDRSKNNPDHYVCTKLDGDYEALETYHISVIGTHEMICTCPAGSKSKCRHRTMLSLFAEKKVIGQKWSYNFDKSTWIPPIGFDEGLDDQDT